MVIHELTADDCREVLGRTSLGRLACCRGGQPYVVPVFLYFDGDSQCFYGFATLGQKIDWMRSSPRVCVEMDDVADQTNWTTVLAFGRYEEVKHSAGDDIARQRAMHRFMRRPDWWLPGAATREGASEDCSPVIYRIIIDRLSGRRAARHTA